MRGRDGVGCRGERCRELAQLPGTGLVAERRSKTGELAQHQRAGLEDVREDAHVHSAAVEEQVRQNVQAAVLAPVVDARRVSVTDVDEPHLLESLEGFAQRVERHTEVRSQLTLARQLLTGGIPAGQQRLQESLEDLL